MDSGPGLMLAQAREEMGLSLDQVAEQMKVSISYLRALETDKYEELPCATFVRGYLRNYARLLQLDEKTVVEMSGAKLGTPPGHTDGVKPLSARGGASRQALMLGAAAVLVTLLALGGFLWRNSALSPAPEASAQAAPPPVAEEPEEPDLAED